jgi:hypothetical protein
MYLHVVNSWGFGWGLAGTCFMDKSYFDDGDLVDAFAIVTPQNDPQDPSPLPKLKTVARLDTNRGTTVRERIEWWERSNPEYASKL